MSSLVLDSALFILLIASVGFAGIGVIGLLLFPDIRSRQYTGTRASLISLGAITLAGIVFGMYASSNEGGRQYSDLIIFLIVLFVLLVILNIIAAQIIQRKSKDIAKLPVNELSGDDKSS
jgi:multisubunit Na+/H+ antiporter MnhG subunit